MAFLHCPPVEYFEKTVRLERLTLLGIPQNHASPEHSTFSYLLLYMHFCRSSDQMIAEFIYLQGLYTTEFLTDPPPNN